MAATEPSGLGGYDPVPSRNCHRLSVVYPIDDRRKVSEQFSTDFGSVGEPVSDYLKLDRLEVFYDMAEHQLPRVLQRVELPGEKITLQEAGVAAERGYLWLVALPHGAHLAVLTLEIDCSLESCIPVMEDLHHRRVRVFDEPLWKGCIQTLTATNAERVQGQELAPDTYQLLFVRRSDHDALQPGGSLASSLIYRYRADYSHETLRVVYPQESNRGSAFAATGPYVGVVSGTQGYVENGMLISALQFLGSVALLREIRLEAFDELTRLRRITAERTSLRARRAVLADMARRLGHLRLELSFGVEAFDRVASLVPSLRIVDFHACLFRCAEVDREAETVSGMLERLEQGLRAEIEKLNAEEVANQERRRQSASAALGFLSAVALPLGLLFAFFGMNTEDVSDSSFLSLGTYAAVYIGLAVLFVAAGTLALGLRLGFWVGDRRDRRIGTRLLS